MTDEHDDLRRLFADATSDIRPHGSYDDIRTRIEKVDPMARRWFLPVIAAAAVMAFVIGGVFWANDDDGGRPGTDPAGTPTPTTAQTLSEARVYYAGPSTYNGGHSLFVETHLLEGVTDVPTAAVQQTISGTPHDPDYTSLWPAGVTVRKVTLSGGPEPTVKVDLAGMTAGRHGLGARDRLLAMNAVARTVHDAFGTDAGVAFYDGDVELDVFGEGLGVTSFPGDDSVMMGPFQITSLTHGQKVPPGNLTVTGVASAFEANVAWELLVGGDAVVDSGFTTAAECCTQAPYSFTLKGLEPGTYTVVVHDEDMSGEGRPVNSDSKDFVVE